MPTNFSRLFVIALASLTGCGAHTRICYPPKPQNMEGCRVEIEKSNFRLGSHRLAGIIRCSTNEPPYSTEFIALRSRDPRLLLSWSDGRTLNVGIPADSLIEKKLPNFSQGPHTVSFTYRPISRSDLSELQCYKKVDDMLVPIQQ